jgi:hypothetical protein
VSNLYVDLATAKATLSLTGTTYADADLTPALDAASRAIEQLCNRRFWKDSSDSSRVYTPSSRTLCLIDDLADVTSVKTDDDHDGSYETTWTENSDYYFEPLNNEIDGWPRTRIIVHPSKHTGFDCWPRTVQVTGKFGWDTVPAAVTQATQIIAVKLLSRTRMAPMGVVAVGVDGAAVRVAGHDPQVADLLAPYRRLTV